jgi:hypothetical protein
MKKIITEKYESFKAKDLKNYSKIVNAYFRRKKYLLLISFTTISCSVQNEINTDGFKKIEPNLNIRFYDKLDTITQYDIRVLTKSLIKDFIDNDKVDYSKPVSLKLEKDKMYLRFTDVYKKEFVLQFHGKLHRKKFVFYTNYKTINFPFLLMKKQMERFKVYISENNDLLIEKYNVSEGMLLLFGAGTSNENMYKFKII